MVGLLAKLGIRLCFFSFFDWHHLASCWHVAWGVGVVLLLVAWVLTSWFSSRFLGPNRYCSVSIIVVPIALGWHDS